MHYYIRSFVLIFIGAMLAGAISISADWTAPRHQPPRCDAGNPGCDAPIHIGTQSQSKLGQLRINTDLVNPFIIGLQVFGEARADDFCLNNPTTTCLSNSSGSGGVTRIIAGNNINISPTGGTGNVTINAQRPQGSLNGRCISNSVTGTGTYCSALSPATCETAGSTRDCLCPSAYELIDIGFNIAESNARYYFSCYKL